jgi:hypothetical protein
MGNQKWPIKRKWQHRVNKTKKNKTQTLCKGGLDVLFTMFGSSLPPVVYRRA